MRLPTLLRALAMTAASCCVLASSAMAQEWPTRMIRLIVPAPPGGISDGVARLLAEQLRGQLGQPVIVDNKPGGSAVIAERALMSAPADGYTLMVGPSSVFTDFPLTVKTPFDPFTTFTYVADVASMVHVLVANNDFPPKTAPEVLAYAAKHKDAVSVANLSTGTRSNLLGELLREQSGRHITVVPYKGSAPAMVDLLGNSVQLTFEVVSNVLPMAKAGKLKPLAIVSAARSPHLPQVPSFGEVGMPDFVLPDASVGVAVLSSMPEPMLQRIRMEIEKVKRAPKFREALAAQGYDAPREISMAELHKQMAATVEQNRRILGQLKTASAK